MPQNIADQQAMFETVLSHLQQRPTCPAVGFVFPITRIDLYRLGHILHCVVWLFQNNPSQTRACPADYKACQGYCAPLRNYHSNLMHYDSFLMQFPNRHPSVEQRLNCSTPQADLGSMLTFLYSCQLPAQFALKSPD